MAQPGRSGRPVWPGQALAVSNLIREKPQQRERYGVLSVTSVSLGSLLNRRDPANLTTTRTIKMATTHDQQIIFEYLDEIEPYTKDELVFELGIGEERVGIALSALVQKTQVVKDATTIPTGYRRR